MDVQGVWMDEKLDSRDMYNKRRFIDEKDPWIYIFLGTLSCVNVYIRLI